MYSWMVDTGQWIGYKSVFYLKSNAMNSVHVGQGCNRVLVSLISWPGQLLSLNPCGRPKILARMPFLGIYALFCRIFGGLPFFCQLFGIYALGIYPLFVNFWGIYALFCRFFGDLCTVLLKFWGFTHFLSNFVRTDVNALLLKFWIFWDLRTFLSIFGGFTHSFVEFCRDRHLRAFVKILA